jgi:hypothetical protein
MSLPLAGARGPRHRGRRLLLLSLLAALGLHALLLAAWLPEREPTPAPQTAPLPAQRVTLAPVLPHPVPEATAPTPRAPVKPRAAAAAPRPLAAAVQSPAAAPPEPAPRYLAPPALHWQYRLRQGDEAGAALLQWQGDEATGGRYQARLARELGGRELPAWRSEGGFDALGLAPGRFAEEQRGRERRATNFRREQGLISFSASREQQPLPPGAQDRLSWMLQLAALLQAEPALRREGAQILLPVAGLRGELGDWRFEVLGREDLLLPVGPVPGALRLRREAAADYEPRIEVWLDPARHHLPVRLRQSQGPLAGEQRSWELELQSEILQP